MIHLGQNYTQLVNTKEFEVFSVVVLLYELLLYIYFLLIMGNKLLFSEYFSLLMNLTFFSTFLSLVFSLFINLLSLKLQIHIILIKEERERSSTV